MPWIKIVGEILIPAARSPKKFTYLRRYERVDHTIQVVEERQQVNGQLDPSLALTLGQHVRVHDAGRIVQARAGHDRAIFVSPYVVRNQWNVYGQREPLSGKQEQQIEQHMQRILGQHQRIERIALVDRIFVVRLQLIERNHVKYREKDEKCIDDQCRDVAEGRKVKSHPLSGVLIFSGGVRSVREFLTLYSLKML